MSAYDNKRPIFLLLTCYEDFHVAKEAVSYQVLEYLVKVELTPDSLKKAVVKAVEGVRLSSCACKLDKDNSLDTPALFEPAPFTFEGEVKCLSAAAPAYSFNIYILEK